MLFCQVKKQPVLRLLRPATELETICQDWIKWVLLVFYFLHRHWIWIELSTIYIIYDFHSHFIRFYYNKFEKINCWNNIWHLQCTIVQSHHTTSWYYEGGLQVRIKMTTYKSSVCYWEKITFTLIICAKVKQRICLIIETKKYVEELIFVHLCLLSFWAI